MCAVLLVASCSNSAPTPQNADVSATVVDEQSDAGRTVGDVTTNPEPADETGAQELLDDEPVEAPPVNSSIEPDAEVQPTVETVVVPDIGESAWAVVVAGASDPFDPLLGATVEDLAAAGFPSTITNCDVGAASAIGMQPGASFTVSVYASNEADAELLMAELDESGLAGPVTEITVQCP